MKPARAIYECRRPGCTFTIVDDTDDVFGFDEEVAEHEDGHLRADAGIAAAVGEGLTRVADERRTAAAIRGARATFTIVDELTDHDRPRPRYRVHKLDGDWLVTDRADGGGTYGEGLDYSWRTAQLTVALFRAFDAHDELAVAYWRPLTTESYDADLARVYATEAVAR